MQWHTVCIGDLDKLNLSWWFDFRPEAFLLLSQLSQQNLTCFKSDSKTYSLLLLRTLSLSPWSTRYLPEMLFPLWPQGTPLSGPCSPGSWGLRPGWSTVHLSPDFWHSPRTVWWIKNKNDYLVTNPIRGHSHNTWHFLGTFLKQPPPPMWHFSF